MLGTTFPWAQSPRPPRLRLTVCGPAPRPRPDPCVPGLSPRRPTWHPVGTLPALVSLGFLFLKVGCFCAESRGVLSMRLHCKHSGDRSGPSACPGFVPCRTWLRTLLTPSPAPNSALRLCGDLPESQGAVGGTSRAQAPQSEAIAWPWWS